MAKQKFEQSQAGEKTEVEELSRPFNIKALISAHRAEQAKDATYRVEGEEMCAYVAGAKIAVAPIPPNQRDAKTARAKAQTALGPAVAKYSEFDIVKTTAADNKFAVLTNDGRKYSVDQRTGKVA